MLLFILASLALSSAQEVTSPPKIYNQLKNTVIYKIGQPFTLPCEATGNPTPTYTWYLRDLAFHPSQQPDRYSVEANSGTFTIKEAQQSDAGTYRCTASNRLGTSVGNMVSLQPAKLEPFQTLEPTYYTRQVGSSLKLRCDAPPSNPPATVYWALQQPDNSLQPLTYDSRVILDQDGSLNFANLQPNDTNYNTQYVCVVHNHLLNAQVQGSNAIVSVTGSVPQSSRTMLMYSTAYAVVSLLNTTTTFQCIFSGMPTPSIVWYFYSNPNPSPANAKVIASGHTLTLPSVNASQTGVYQCRGYNDQPYYASSLFSLTVESAPSWVQRPLDSTVRQGQSAVFHCQAHGTPTPTVYWFVNGVQIALAPPNDNRVVKDGSVYFSNVKLTDATNLQCNATNKHGHVFADVFLNVI